MSGGPQPRTRAERLAVADAIANRILSLHPDVIAVGLYGSLARGSDGPYSDVETLCVLPGHGQEYNYEWTCGPWKAEVNFYSRDNLLCKAAEVDGDWPLTHGAYRDLRPLYDPGQFLAQVHQTVLSQSAEKFTTAIKAVIVGELYEWVGKLRNIQAGGSTAYLPELALNMAKYGAFIIGLDNRHLYTTGPRLLEEALNLPGRPAGFDALCCMTMQGDLSNAGRIGEAAEAFWAGVEQWAAERNICLEESNAIPF